MKDCPFCRRIADGDVTHRSALAAAFPDSYPLSEGHSLVVPIEHTADLFAASSETIAEVWALVGIVRNDLVERLHPDGMNVGLNSLEAAGQTIAHAHVHVIPRFRGDVDDPRGGVRWVVPSKAPYWESREPDRSADASD